MQAKYRNINNSLNQKIFNLEYCTSHWADCRKPLQDFLLGPPQEKFIDFSLPGLCWAYWEGFNHLNEWQLIYLQDCLCNRTKKRLKMINSTL